MHVKYEDIFTGLKVSRKFYTSVNAELNTAKKNKLKIKDSGIRLYITQVSESIGEAISNVELLLMNKFDSVTRPGQENMIELLGVDYTASVDNELRSSFVNLLAMIVKAESIVLKATKVASLSEIAHYDPQVFSGSHKPRGEVAFVFDDYIALKEEASDIFDLIQ